MSDENITSEALDGEGHVDDSSSAPETVESKEDQQEVLSKEQLSGLSLEELNETLGKQFKDKASALKSLQDTFSFVGKKVEQIEEELKSNGYLSKRELEDVLFYRDNPSYSAYQDVIDAYANKHGISPKEAVKSEALNGLFAKAQKADSYEETQSVIESNPRYVASKSNLEKAREVAYKTGRTDQVESLVAKAVLDAFES